MFRILTFVSLLLTLLLRWTPETVHAQVITITNGVAVSAGIDPTSLTIYGYTSPNNKVELTNPKIYDQTYSNDLGYFEFNHIIVPKLPGELCLVTTDTAKRQSVPTCIPPPPPTNYHTTIGPIILPPTISLDQNNLTPNQNISASGQSLPNTTLTIHLYQKNLGSPLFPVALAFYLPQVTTQTDAHGNYSISLPSTYATSYRLFTTSMFQTDFVSPNSNTIYFTLPSFTTLIWQKYAFYIIMLPLLIVSLIALAFLTKKYYSQTRYLPYLYPKTLIIR